MRFSYQRDIIYNSIYGVNSHPTAADIFNMVRSQITNISLGTVYRNLTQLIQEHMILDLNIGGISHYDANMDPHQHFYCKICKSIFDCHTQNEWKIENFSKVKEFDIQEIDIIFSGLCKICKPN